MALATSSGCRGGAAEFAATIFSVPGERIARVDFARRDRIDADAARREIGGHFTGERGECRLGGRVGGPAKGCTREPAIEVTLTTLPVARRARPSVRAPA